MLSITKRQIKYNTTPRGSNKIEWLVIHYTANYSKGANAAMHFSYFNGGNRASSADFFVDDKSIWQINDYTKFYCWSVGDAKKPTPIKNRNSISIEMCVNVDSDFNKTVQNTIELVKYLMQELNIDIEHVVRHFDVSGKSCPKMYVEDERAWLMFKTQLKPRVKIDNLSDAVQMLTVKGYIQSSQYWMENAVGSKMVKGAYVRTVVCRVTNIQDYNQAIDYLAQQKVINTASYWKFKDEFLGEYVQKLLIALANL